MPDAVNNLTAIRGSALTFIDDPFRNFGEDSIAYQPDAVIVMSDGVISHFGPAQSILQELPADLDVTRYDNCLIMPGMIDCHVHYPQTEIIGSYARELIEWLEKHTFRSEQKFSDFEYARAAAKLFLREMLRSGTTTASVFCTVDPESVDAFFGESEKLNMRNIAGKVLMDRNAPAQLLDTPQTAYDQTKELIERWHGKGRSLYSVTPRFAPTSSPEQMELTGAVWNEHPGTYLQSHVSETPDEITWVGKLFPGRRNYVDVYEHYDQLGPRSILGHGIHLSEPEYQVLHDSGTALAHCPTSNLFLGSGLFDIGKATDQSRPVRLGLATDLGGGTSFSQLTTMGEAYKIAQLSGFALSAERAFYLATRGAAKALYLEDKIGSIEVGHEADITVLDLHATPLLQHRLEHASDLSETMFVLMTLGDDRVTCATYIAGNLAYARGHESADDYFADA